jgi:hypothetical protein
MTVQFVMLAPVDPHTPSECQNRTANSTLATGKGRKMLGLTSKEHLYLRVLSIVTIINAVTFYVASRNLQSFIANFTEVITMITVLTLFVLIVNLEFWWRLLRRSDNKRFWKPQTKEEMN